MTMMLTVTEAAQLLGQSPRTVRARLVRGDLPGRKRGSQWIVPRDRLPLPEAEHRRLQAQAEQIRETVEAALPSRVTSRVARRSVVDEAAFRAIHAARQQLAADPSRGARRASRSLERALHLVAEGVNEWRGEAKRQCFVAARAEVSRACAWLAADAPLPPPEPVRSWLAALEQEVLPPRAGLCRSAERSDRRLP
jgi:excisionase family DNA binding protein